MCVCVCVCAQEAAEIAYRLIRKDLLPDPHHQIMRKMVDRMLGEHSHLFSLINKKVTEPADLFSNFVEMYGDEKINWGRLVLPSLFAVLLVLKKKLVLCPKY